LWHAPDHYSTTSKKTPKTMSANNATSLHVAATNLPSTQTKTNGSASGLQSSPMLANVTNKPHAKNPKTTNSFKSQQMKKIKPLHPLSGGSPTDVDSAYCTEVARRSVARAALHLGMEGMEGMALDALTSVYLGYMDMVGSTISTMVESSGRSSAHVNAYDAINAIEDCTAPAAAQLTSACGGVVGTSSVIDNDDENTENGDDESNQYATEECQVSGWEELAKFLFGSDWYSIPLEGDGDDEALRLANAKIGFIYGKNSLSTKKSGLTVNSNGAKKPGGKTILPKMPESSATLTGTTVKGKQISNFVSAAAASGGEKSVSFAGDLQSSFVATNNATNTPTVGEGRWNAPYLGQLAPFPLVSSAKSIANPHRMEGTNAVLSLHDLAMEVEACRGRGLGLVGDKKGLGPLTKRPKKGSSGGSSSSSKSNGDKTNIGRSLPSTAKNVTDPRFSAEFFEKAQLAEERAMRAELRIPQDVYFGGDRLWGCIRNNDDSMDTDKDDKEDGKKSMSTEAAKSTSSKDVTTKVTFGVSSKAPQTADAFVNSQQKEQDQNKPTDIWMPPYVPIFLPAFPPSSSSETGPDGFSSSVAASQIMGKVFDHASYRREKRKLRMSESNPMARGASEGLAELSVVSDSKSLRRSVIGLGKSPGLSYWGSDWLNSYGADGGKESRNGLSNINLPAVSVTPGVTGKNGSDPQAVAPLGRASGSRVSKILEGSMNI